MHCPICHWSGEKFKQRKGDYLCPECKSKGRHRHIAHMIHKLSFKIAGAEILLVGGSPPEQQMFPGSKFVERMSNGNASHGRVMLDMADMHLFTKNQFNFVFACHVLEHVEKLEKALAETYRVLKPGGRAVFCVPVPTRQVSKKRDAPVAPGHWWVIGRDWPDYYKAAGFSTSNFYGKDCPKDLMVKPNNVVSVCLK